MPLLEGSKISHIENVVMVKRSHEVESYLSKRTRRSSPHDEAWSDVAHSESSADGMKIRISLPKKAQGVMKSTSSLSLSSQTSQTSQTSVPVNDTKDDKLDEEGKRGNGEMEEEKEENVQGREEESEEKGDSQMEKLEKLEKQVEKQVEKLEKSEEKQEENPEVKLEKPAEKPEEKLEKPEVKLEKPEEKPEEKPVVKEEEKELGVSSSPRKKKLAPAEHVIMCVSGSHLHIWPLPELSSLKQGSKSLCIDLSAFVPGLSIEDVAFLDGFDKEGRIVGVAGAGGVVLILNCRKQELLWKVPAGIGVNDSWKGRTRRTCTA